MIPDDKKSSRRQPASRGFAVIPGDGRPLPHSLEAEEHLLCCCLIDGGSVMKRCLDAGVQERHFYLPAHGIVFEALVALYEKQVPLDVCVVAEELKSKGQLEGVGGLPFLVRVNGGVATTMDAGYFIDRVIDLAIRRRMIREGMETAENSYEFDGDLREFTAVQAEKFQAIAEFVMKRSRKMTQRGAAIEAEEEAAAEAAGLVDRSQWLYWPLAKLDREFLPIDVNQEDFLNIVAAPPSGGKSSYLSWLAGHWLRNGKRGAVFLIEGLRKRWIKGLAASFAGINLRNLEDTATLFPEKYAEFTNWMTTIKEWMETRLWVFEVNTLEDVVRITREINRTVRENDIKAGLSEGEAHGLDFVVGDYLQILQTRRQFLKRNEELAHIVRALKHLHRSLNVPGFWGAQITREARNEVRRPTLADLGESKSLEENADRVHFIHVPPNTDPGAAQSSAVVNVEIIQRKSRNGPKDVAVGLVFEGPVRRFSDTSRKTFDHATLPQAQSGRVNKGDFL